ncbi:adenylate/guanylate cyclase domain-containing protein, partial [Microvirga yunnanensis]|uniref:adenylate/guanylate cyclase domain-containing protein n=1 Tax=Microvirga yunnanensis TaxID=2953740 RepID=UPI0021C5C6AE
MGPQEHKVERRLAAIFAADMAGYSRLMERDEVGTLKALTAHREVIDRLITEHGGRIANTAGDSVLAEFPSAVEAVQCAMAVQEALVQANQDTPEERRLQFRIGVHVGDVMVRAGDLLGDGVNIAARLESLADPGGLCISEATYGYVRKALPHAFEDLGPQTVKNIEEPVRAFVLKAAAMIPAGQERAKPLPLPDKPSIAVLPFRNMSGDPEQDYLADGLTEEIVAALSRFRSLFVIAYSSTATYKGKAVDVRQVSRELGARYVLEGSIRKEGNRLRVITQLIDATTGSHIWTDRYDGDVTDLFDLQDRVTEAIVGALEPTITLSEIEWAKRKRPDSLDAYGCVMRALPAVWSQDPHKKAEGLRLAEQAMDLDPSYPLPKALAAWCYAQRVMSMTTSNPATTRTRALQLAREAASLDSNDPLVLTVLSAAYNLIGQVALGLAAVEKALTLDPNSAWAWLRSGWSNTYMRRYDTAIEHFQRAMRLSPLDPMRFSALIGIGAAYL